MRRLRWQRSDCQLSLQGYKSFTWVETSRHRDKELATSIPSVNLTGRKLGQEVIREIKIYVEPGQVSPDRIDRKVRKNKAAIGVFGMRQGVEPLRV
jgi:hypothetical protein